MNLSAAAAVVALTAATAGLAWMQGLRAAAVLLLLGLGYGFVLQRTRLCFASAFYGNRELLRGILLSLAVASAGSALVMELGWNRPPRIPFGLHTLVGAALFGFFMPFAGGCMTGTLYRLGMGQSKSLAAFWGILVGNGLGAAYAWPFTERLLDRGWRIYLPDLIGLGPATLLNLAALGILALRLGPRPGAAPFPASSGTFLERILKHPWPAWAGGMLFALLFVIQFAYHSALGVQLPLARFVLWVAGTVKAGAQEIPWTRYWGMRIPALDPGFHLDAGLILGALTGALLAGEFAGFRPWRTREALVGFLGGVGMGVAVWVAVGCNVSGFWSAVATLRVDGWIYALGLYLGARTGLRATAFLVGRGLL
ncbi:MAG: YeeE/YedE family protein [Armatimonadota bacterium]|nr:YeeE/YedE family protein [Armatimonadota bacterium]MDR7440323.1 YeeE/YedE family protein [Armatimonadota bacterium]MDR7563696.1 YeeE/YedE family protein [Armatimonadota bacterium]MDR7568831.1 YeeE/YedE family protein [Armatimonadota bacterium]MDR7602016.1 YeeE/YedE family protein [Armatimonadota bacterium]